MTSHDEHDLRDEWHNLFSQRSQERAVSRLMQQKVAEREQLIETWEPGLPAKVRRLLRRCLENRAALLPLVELRFSQNGWFVHTLHSTNQLELLFRTFLTEQSVYVDPSAAEKNEILQQYNVLQWNDIRKLRYRNASSKKDASPVRSWFVIEAAAVLANQGGLVFADPHGITFPMLSFEPRLFVIAPIKQIVPELREAYQLIRLEQYLLFGAALPPASIVYNEALHPNDPLTDKPLHHLVILG